MLDPLDSSPSCRDPAPPARERCADANVALHVDNGAAAAEPALPVVAPLGTLLTQHILRDGERVILVLRPSLWFILLVCLRVVAGALIVMLAARLFSDRLSPRLGALAVELGLLLIVVRLMFAVLQWSSRLYVLTELRLLRLAGIFSPEIFDCPLRKVARARLIRPFRERVLGLGSIEIIPIDHDAPMGTWHTIAHPREIHRLILATIAKARQGGKTIG